MNYTIPIQLQNYNRRKDKSVSFKVDSELEIPSEDISTIDALVGNLGVLLIGKSAVSNMNEAEVEKMLKDMPKYDATKIKSPSKRYRNILWRVLEKKLNRQPTNDEFIKYYDERYEELCQKGIDYLDNDF